jgi:hypothetical protein
VLRALMLYLKKRYGFECWAVLGLDRSVSHWSWTRTDALEWCACYGKVATAVHLYRRGVLEGTRYPVQ